MFENMIVLYTYKFTSCVLPIFSASAWGLDGDLYIYVGGKLVDN